MYKLTNKFFWENSLILEHELEIDLDFLTKYDVTQISEKELIKIFDHYYGIDISDYGLRNFVITEPQTNLQIQIKGVDQLRQLQLRKLL